MRFRNIVLLVLVVMGTNLNGQINERLAELSKALSFENDTTLYKAILESKSASYDLWIDKDTLFINSEVKDVMSKRTTIVTPRKVKIPMNEVLDIQGPNPEKLSSSNIVFKSDNNNPGFYHSVDNNEFSKTSFEVLQGHRPASAKILVEIVDILNSKYDFSANKPDPRCIIKEVQSLDGNNTFSSHVNKELQEKITLNGNDNLDKEVLSVVTPFMEENKMNSLSFQLVISDKDDIVDIGIMEYHGGLMMADEMEKATEEQRKMAYEMFGFISKEVNDKLVTFIKSQDWKTGKCNGEKVQSHYNFELLKKE